MGLGQQTSTSQPFTGGQPLYSGKISGQHPVGGKPSTSRSFSMGAYPPIGSQPLFDWGKPPTGGKPPATGPYSLWGKQSTGGKPPTIRTTTNMGPNYSFYHQPTIRPPLPRNKNIVWNQHQSTRQPYNLTQPGGGPPYGGDLLGDHPMVEDSWGTTLWWRTP
jgi:hypothetical protein